MARVTATLIGLSLMVVGAAPMASGQARPDPAALTEAQRDAMNRFAFMDGEWRGSAWTILPSGERQNLTQTERIGPFLGGAVRVIEGRGYTDDARLAFNAFGIISYDPATKKYSMRSYAMGRLGDFDVMPTDDGYQWEIPAGPATIRYTASIKDGTWTETGDRIMPGQEPFRFFEMTLERIGDTDWPAAGVVPPE
jgi:hypothetical protein